MSTNLKRLIRTAKRGDLIVTPVIDRWLVQHPEGVVLDDDLLTKLRAITTKMPRDRSSSWAASARGSCLRSQVFTYMGTKQASFLDPRRQNLFNDGTWRHIRWQMMMLSAGLLKDIEVPVYKEHYNMVGTMDGEGDGWGFELKGIYSLSAVNGTGPLDHHLLQIHSYFLARPDLKKFVLVYEDKRTQEYKEFVIDRDPALMKAVRRELAALQRSVSDKELPEVLDECKSGKGQTFNGCPYKTTCLEIADWSEAETYK